MIGKPNRKLLIPSLLAVLAGATMLFALPKTHSEIITKVNHQEKTTTLFFAGDIMLSRNVEAKMAAANDYTLPFQKIADTIAQADISFANLESPFKDSGKHYIDGSLVFNANPKSIEGLKLSGFDILSTANNHSFDQGQAGIEYTKKWLAENGITPIGTGDNCHQGQIITKNMMTFGFLAYSYAAYNDGGKKPDPLVCDANDLAQVAKDIRSLRPQVDYLIVSSHMGIEYTRTPSPFAVNFAHNAVDAGADLIIGNHPHWVQTIEQYQNKWIFYAMGNLVFDQMWSLDTRQGLTATLNFKNKSLTSIELKPVMIDDFCCARWADDAETKTILTKINPGYSSPFLVVNGKIEPSWQTSILPK